MKSVINSFKATLMVAAALLTIFTSCSGPSNSLKGIPSESSYVSVVNLYSLIKKGEFEQIENSRFFRDANEELRDENKRVSDMLKDAWKDPRSTGIDFTEDVVSFSTNEYKGEHFTNVLVALSDKDKFKKFLLEMLDESEVEYEIENNETHTLVKIERRGVGVAWDNGKAILLTPTDYKSRENMEYQANRMFSLEEDEQLLSNKEFQKFLGDKEDISMWVSSDIIKSFMSRRYYRRMEEESDLDLEDNYLSAHLSFDEGKVTMNISADLNEKYAELYGTNKMLTEDFNRDLLAFFPENHIFLASMSMNPEDFIEEMMENEKYDEMMDKLREESGPSPEKFEEALESFKEFGGSFVFSLFDVKYQEVEQSDWMKEYYEGQGLDVPKRHETIPSMAFAFDIKDGELIKKLQDDLQSKRKNGYYEVREGGMNWYGGFKNSMVFVTNQENLIQSFIDGDKPSNSILDSEIKSDILDNGTFASLKMNYDDMPKEMKKLIEDSQSSREKKMFDQWKDFANDIQMKNNGNNSFEIVLDLKNKDENSLKQIVEKVSEFRN